MPTFLVLGAMRAGTTTLYYELSEHPEVYMAAIKEPNFFAFEDGETDLPLTDDSQAKMISASTVTTEDYYRLFRGANSAKAVGDISPSYLYSPTAATRIHAALPDARLIALLRDPVDRAFSAYLRRAGAINDPQAFLEAAETEQRDLDVGKRQPLYPLILGGLYARHLDPYVKLFPSSKLWIRLYEEFWASPDRSYPDLHEFIGVEPLRPAEDVRLNRSGIPRYPRVDRMIRSGSRLKGYTKRHLPSGVVRWLVKAKQKVEDLSMKSAATLPRDIRGHLIERYFESDIKKLEVMLGRDLSAWRQS
jgi:hypothetical protein